MTYLDVTCRENSAWRESTLHCQLLVHFSGNDIVFDIVDPDAHWTYLTVKLKMGKAFYGD